jgi:hypothetical protein
LFDVVPLHALQVTVVESGPHHEKEWVFWSTRGQKYINTFLCLDKSIQYVRGAHHPQKKNCFFSRPAHLVKETTFRKTPARVGSLRRHHLHPPPEASTLVAIEGKGNFSG